MRERHVRERENENGKNGERNRSTEEATGTTHGDDSSEEECDWREENVRAASIAGEFAGTGDSWSIVSHGTHCHRKYGLWNENQAAEGM